MALPSVLLHAAYTYAMLTQGVYALMLLAHIDTTHACVDGLSLVTVSVTVAEKKTENELKHLECGHQSHIQGLYVCM